MRDIESGEIARLAREAATFVRCARGGYCYGLCDPCAAKNRLLDALDEGGEDE